MRRRVEGASVYNLGLHLGGRETMAEEEPSGPWTDIRSCLMFLAMMLVMLAPALLALFFLWLVVR